MKKEPNNKQPFEIKSNFSTKQNKSTVCWSQKWTNEFIGHRYILTLAGNLPNKKN